MRIQTDWTGGDNVCCGKCRGVTLVLFDQYYRSRTGDVRRRFLCGACHDARNEAEYRFDQLVKDSVAAGLTEVEGREYVPPKPPSRRTAAK